MTGLLDCREIRKIMTTSASGGSPAERLSQSRPVPESQESRQRNHPTNQNAVNGNVRAEEEVANGRFILAAANPATNSTNNVTFEPTDNDPIAGDEEALGNNDASSNRSDGNRNNVAVVEGVEEAEGDPDREDDEVQRINDQGGRPPNPVPAREGGGHANRDPVAPPDYDDMIRLSPDEQLQVYRNWFPWFGDFVDEAFHASMSFQARFQADLAAAGDDPEAVDEMFRNHPEYAWHVLEMRRIRAALEARMLELEEEQARRQQD